MHNFCTLFDSYYLSRGFVMYESLKEHMEVFHLYIIAFDDLSLGILRRMSLSFTTIISLKEFESLELLAVKQERSHAEYCWTSTPSAVDYVLRKYNLNACTYIDADLFFFSSPIVLLEEMNEGSSGLITEHRYSWLHRIYAQKRAGRFCVQFISFNRLPESREILDTWKKQCIKWCFDRYENGKFGDQKYLDEWPGRYPHVHILNHLGGGLAPWNVQQYRLFEEDGALVGLHRRRRNNFRAVFFHFQYVKLLGRDRFDIGWHRIPRSVKRLVYLPYFSRILETEKMLETRFPDYRTKYAKVSYKGIRGLPKKLLKRVFGYNLIFYTSK